MATDASFMWLRPATELESLMDGASKKGVWMTVCALTLRCSVTLTDAHVKAALHHLFRLVLHTHTHTHTHTLLRSRVTTHHLIILHSRTSPSHSLTIRLHVINEDNNHVSMMTSIQVFPNKCGGGLCFDVMCHQQPLLTQWFPRTGRCPS